MEVVVSEDKKEGAVASTQDPGNQEVDAFDASVAAGWVEAEGVSPTAAQLCVDLPCEAGMRSRAAALSQLLCTCRGCARSVRGGKKHVAHAVAQVCRYGLRRRPSSPALALRKQRAEKVGQRLASSIVSPRPY